MLVHVTVILRNLKFACITIKDKFTKYLYNSHLRKLPIAHEEISVMNGDLFGLKINKLSKHMIFCNFERLLTLGWYRAQANDT